MITIGTISFLSVLFKGSFFFFMPKEVMPDEDFESWLDDDGFKKQSFRIKSKKYLFDELEKLKEQFRKGLKNHIPTDNQHKSTHTVIQVFNLINAHKIRINKVRLIIDHELLISVHPHKPTGVNYIVARTYWYDKNGKKFRKFSKHLGPEDKVYVNKKVPISKLEEISEEIDMMMWEQYLLEYKTG